MESVHRGCELPDEPRPALSFAGLRVGWPSPAPRAPALVETRYSGLSGGDDGEPGDDAGCAAGDTQGEGN